MSHNPESILLVDDNTDQLALTTILLQAEGWAVWTARNGVEALRVLSDHAIGCMVTDLFMPEMDGVELTAEVRRRYPQIKVVAVSGRDFGHTDYLDTASLIGADETLKKPFTTAELIAALQRVLGGPFSP